ncbi:MAG: DUF4330 family protein [Acidobacteria bacterium]|nr:DUF4330 family protein [Acidobacteriota bacterium]
MSVVDSRGRLFGRVNLIDAIAVGFVAFGIPIAFVAYGVFHVQAPVIAGVTPTSFSVEATVRRMRVTGDHFRPYLRAYVSRTGEPLTVDTLSQTLRANFLIETTKAVELKLPDNLLTGVYDLYLFDEGREVARRVSTFSITTPDVPRTVDAHAGERATLEIGVRFDIENGLLDSIKVGDVDVNQPGTGPPSPQPATLLSLQPISDRAAVLSVPLGDGANIRVLTAPTRALMNGRIRLGAVRNNNIWEYSRQHVRLGERFSFLTTTYVIQGTITRMTMLPASEQKATP